MNAPRTIAVAIGFILVLGGGRGRADAPAGRYLVAAGVVTDSKTTLSWQQAPLSVSQSQNVTDPCPALGNGWRLPTLKELLTLVDETRTKPALDPIFQVRTSLFYLSSSMTSLSTVPSLVFQWGIDFSDGSTVMVSGGEARCVRDGAAP